MKWSIQELFMALGWQWTGWWWRKLVESPKSIYRNIKTTIHWIFTGYTNESLWSLDNWLDKVILFRLKRFASYDRMGHPSGGNEVNTEEEWQAVLDTMIEGFEEIYNEDYFKESFMDQEKAYTKSKKKKDLFWKWYGHLWD